MGFWDRWKLGAKAVALASAVVDALRDIDAGALLEAAAQVLRLERDMPESGSGHQKWVELVQWFAARFPQYADRVDMLSAVVRALVSLYNAVGLFRSRVNAG
jgi:hypothetical protein